MSTTPKPFDAVALLNPRPADGLARGQVGTIVEELDATTVLVEFSDDRGRAYAITPVALSDLMILRIQPQAAE